MKLNDKLIGLVMLAIVLRLAIGAVAYAMPGPASPAPERHFGYKPDLEASERFLERLRDERRAASPVPQPCQCAPTSVADFQQLARVYVLYGFGGLAGVCAVVWMAYVACWLCDRDMGLRPWPSFPLGLLLVSVAMSLLAAVLFAIARTL